MVLRRIGWILAAVSLTAAAATRNSSAVPMVFEANAEQTDPTARFIARGRGYTLFLTQDGAVFRSGRGDVRMKLVGASSNATFVGMDPLGARVNYLIGAAPSEWSTGVPAFGRVELRGAYPGIDVIFTSLQGRLEYTFVVAPGADAGAVQIAFEGDQCIDIDPMGALVVKTADGYFRHWQPHTTQSRAGRQTEVRTRYVRTGEHGAAFQLEEYDRGRELTIDPTVDYSTYLGGPGSDAVTGMAVDSSGNLYVSGWTESTSFPAPNSKAGTTGGVDIFVAKLNPAGTAIVYVTYLGGHSADYALGLAVDHSASAVVTGWTSSSDFPVAAAAQPHLAGLRNAFVAKLNAAGNGLMFGTYLGGNGSDNGNAIALDAAGNIYLAGDTTSTNFPTVNAIQKSLAGPENAFVAKLSSSGAVAYSTYYGGSAIDSATAIAVDTTGNAYIAGGTWSSNLPVVSAFQSHNAGGQDAFVAKLNAAGSALLYSTYLGGSGGNANYAETATGIGVDNSGSAYVAGVTSSSNFPIVGAAQGALNGALDAFVAKLNTAGSAVVYSTYLGGSSGVDNATAIAVDSAGDAYVVGFTASSDFPVAAAVQHALAGQYDAYVAKLNPSGNSLLISTYLGGTGMDAAYALALDNSGALYVAGETQSFDFLSAAALESNKAAVISGFVVKLPNGAVVNPVLTAPTAGTVLAPSPVTFAWNAVPGAVDYRIDVGTSAGNSNIFTGYTGGVTSIAVALSQFLNGQPVYVEIYSEFSGTPVVTGTGNQYSFATASPDFSVSLSSSQTVIAGAAAGYTATIVGINDFNGAVTFTVSGLPAGASAGFNPISVTGSGSTTMTISTSSTSSAGAYPLTVTAVSGNLSHTAGTSLTLTAGTGSFTPIRVNAGGPAYTDSLGNHWSADTGYGGGTTFATSAPIANTSDATLYQTERWADGNLTYSFSVPNGSYTVTLKFAEIFFTTAGQRICNIVLNGMTVKANFDIVAAAGGGRRAYDVSYPVTVTGGQITVTLAQVVSNPKISAVAIVLGQASAFTPIRVNAGGPAYTDSLGNVWSADTGYQGGNTDALGAGTSISNTADQTLYQTERWNSGSLVYSFAVPNGSYTVTLKFAEIYFASSGQRICNIVLNGATVKSNFDIVAAAGAAKRAYDLSYPVTVTGGQITVTLVSVVSNPKISAIAIVQAQASAFTPIRVNAGGPAYTDSLGNVWSADTGYQGGNTDALGAGTSISNTADQTLYQTERWNSGSLVYSFAVPNGSYTVTLKFAEIYFASSNQRICNIVLNGTTVKTNFDIVAAAGGANRAYDLSYPVTVTGGQITVTLVSVVSNPKISAIAIQ